MLLNDQTLPTPFSCLHHPQQGTGFDHVPHWTFRDIYAVACDRPMGYANLKGTRPRGNHPREVILETTIGLGYCIPWYILILKTQRGSC